jgi:hypothetical protein
MKKTAIMKRVTMTPNNSEICLRQGYGCKCNQCQIWIDRWNHEIEAFIVIEKLMTEGKSLFHIFERLRAEFPDVLRLYHQTIENQYINYKIQPVDVVAVDVDSPSIR